MMVWRAMRGGRGEGAECAAAAAAVAAPLRLICYEVLNVCNFQPCHRESVELLDCVEMMMLLLLLLLLLLRVMKTARIASQDVEKMLLR